ncbi:PREDICTED: uncharacterized protein LOC109462390 [Branchiostoma belcheri]|uniref:Uncharacterized protein LOC109462390 n=1 Tax=Branchiostoma belcheri TaxID=7741 RepID=A0A6P4XV47_BRABE|nr:PREDICTED: uncharacterized protein LOC109462390 [Branchiostoma belcheri]
MATSMEHCCRIPTYVEQKPTKTISRNVKIGTHRARGQEPDQERATLTTNNQNKAKNGTHTASHKRKKKQERSRQRSSFLDDLHRTNVTSIINFLRKAIGSQPTKRPRESSSSSETTQTLPAKKAQTEEPQQWESPRFHEEETIK